MISTNIERQPSNPTSDISFASCSSKVATRSRSCSPSDPNCSPLHLDREILAALQRIASALEQLTSFADRVVEVVAPDEGSVVDSVYVARRLGGCTTTWVAELARTGEIPVHCIVPGTGNGKPWKFHRKPIDKWIKDR